MMQLWHWTWATVAFASELAALAALAVGGWALPGPTALRLTAAIGLPLAAAGLWGLFAAPHAVVQIAALAAVVKLVVLGGAVLLAGTLAVAAVLGAVLSPGPDALLSAAG
jgi:hypothetical protein